MKKNIYLILLACLVGGNMWGQGWQRRYGQSHDQDLFHEVINTPDGGYLATGNEVALTGNNVGWVLYRLDPEGQEIWRSAPEKEQGELGFSRQLLDDILLTNTGEIFTTNGGSIYKYGASGEHILFATDTGHQNIRIRGLLPDGLVTAVWPQDPNDNAAGLFELRKYDYNGALLWSKEQTLSGWANYVDLTPAGEFLAINHFQTAIDSLCKFDASGNLQWSIALAKGCQKIEFDSAGNYVVFSNYSDLTKIITVSPDGIILKTISFTNTDFTWWGGFCLLPNGDYLITGMTFYYPTDPYLFRIGHEGNVIWQRKIPSSYSVTIYDAALNSDGTFVVVGEEGEPGGGVTFTDAIIWKFNSDGLLYQNTISGRVAHDVNDNCSIETNEPGLQGWKVEGNGLLAITDSTGWFELQADSGTTILHLYNPGIYWQPCSSSTSVTINGNFENVVQNMPVSSLVDCTQMQIGIGFPFLRRCFENTATINWCNFGTIASPETEILVVLPPELDFVSATWPISQMISDSLWFDIGLVNVNDCGSFHLTAIVDCDSTEIDQALCVEAYIFPDSFCMPPPEWSGASVGVNARCVGDTLIEFTIMNDSAVPTA